MTTVVWSVFSFVFCFPEGLEGLLVDLLFFQLVKWDQYSFASAMGPAAVELLTTGLDGYTNQAKRVEELFGKIWPPPNV